MSPAPGRFSLATPTKAFSHSAARDPPALANQSGQPKEVCPKQGHGFGGGCSGRCSASCWAEVMSRTENQSESSPLGISKAKLAVPYGNAEQHAHTVSGQRHFSQEFMWPDMFNLLHFREPCMQISR